ncbi:MAG: hypothetical protein KIS96_03625 [Bauldia sp.]|nr:hypothetical protein [Bauldia sp.]
MAAAMRAAGIDTASAKLYTEASTLLAERGDPVKAAGRLADIAATNREIRMALALSYVLGVAADMKLPGSATVFLPQGQGLGAAAGQPDEDGEAIVQLPQGQVAPASPSSPNREQEGLDAVAGKAPAGVPSARGPSRPEAMVAYRDRAGRFAPRRVGPTVEQLAAARDVQRRAAKTVLDTWRIRDGRAIGDVTFAELESLRLENAQEASILRQIKNHIANADPSAKVRDLIKAEQFQRFIQRAAEVADAA